MNTTSHSHATHSSSSQNNVWFAVSIGLAGIILGYSIALSSGRSAPSIGAANPSAPNVPSIPSQKDAQPEAAAQPVAPVDARKDFVLGPASAKVSLIVYMDYECPFCKRHHDTITALRKTYSKDVNFVIRQFPLSFHTNAQKESEAAICVGKLGGSTAFWKFSDLILERTTAGGTGFPLSSLPGLAKESGVDEKKFSSCLDGGEMADEVLSQQTAGQAAGVNGTPGNILLNNTTKESRVISGAVPLSTMTAAIDAMLGKK